MISLMWAMDENGVIGKDNQLPWHLPEDLKFFKRTTMGRPIVMGRKTWDSIGRPLPGRENIVITRDRQFTCDDCTVFYSLEEMLTYCSNMEEVFVIGGAEIFKQILPAADRLYITSIHETFEGDTYFPDLDLSQWTLQSREQGIKDEKNPYDYEFLIYQK
ncbi:dihydrofolate reductase [Cytobacillus gottheilii]|uniref:dihydrofolate reductase n=1 Tax=Cytobacillus gottheilii TaxID=859144 RepID=UPI0009BA7A0F|nr:dihydrofolate reductase [Cytobacillus gottheilii]